MKAIHKISHKTVRKAVEPAPPPPSARPVFTSMMPPRQITRAEWDESETPTKKKRRHKNGDCFFLYPGGNVILKEPVFWKS